MRIATCLLSTVAGLALVTGCTGPEQKLGRGLGNMMELTRMGEMRRSMEQTALWDGPDAAYTTGVMRGFNRTMARTMVGLYEVVTFPVPKYDPLFTTYLAEKPVYPDSYQPRLLADPIFGPDANLGFSGGDVTPFIPGSRFHVFDY
jgi:putative exosortase-associated protein (TIGR04073 family)